jgi:hypothetical protein
MIKSINEDTDLHKDEFNSVVWMDRDPWSYLEKVSDSYIITPIESKFQEGHYYEYHITFDNGTTFHAAIADYRRRFSLEFFEPINNP